MKLTKLFILVLIFLLSSNIFSQEAKYGFALQGSLNFPTGDFDNYYNTALGGIGGVFYNITKTTRASLLIGYNGWQLDLDAFNKKVKENGNLGRYNIEAPINAIPILADFKVFFSTQSNFSPYLMFEAGVYRITREVYGKYINENGISSNVTRRVDNSNDASVALGFGVEYPMNENLSFDLNGKYTYLFNENVHNLGDLGYGTSYSTNNFFSFSAGVNIFFQ